MDKITVFLKEKSIRSNVNSIFWVEIPADLLFGTQHEHRDCRPYVFAAQLGDDWFKGSSLKEFLSYFLLNGI
jgi:hypothetical protein